ncbi:MAG TPA: hypothetical protein VKH43_03765, partial [Thermoanaerobaculia bacterium]|nr:hypothetical protein [Thermoanaerobaculia bacterium]
QCGSGHIFSQRASSRGPGLSCHFQPMRYGPEELVRRVAKIRRDFYTHGSALRRLPIPRSQSHLAAWNLHFLQKKVANNLDSMRDFTEF